MDVGGIELDFDGRGHMPQRATPTGPEQLRRLATVVVLDGTLVEDRDAEEDAEE